MLAPTSHLLCTHLCTLQHTLLFQFLAVTCICIKFGTHLSLLCTHLCVNVYITSVFHMCTIVILLSLVAQGLSMAQVFGHSTHREGDRTLFICHILGQSMQLYRSEFKSSILGNEYHNHKLSQCYKMYQQCHNMERLPFMGKKTNTIQETGCQ